MVVVEMVVMMMLLMVMRIIQLTVIFLSIAVVVLHDAVSRSFSQSRKIARWYNRRAVPARPGSGDQTGGAAECAASSRHR